MNNCFTHAETETLQELINSCFSGKGHQLLHCSENLSEIRVSQATQVVRGRKKCEMEMHRLPATQSPWAAAHLEHNWVPLHFHRGKSSWVFLSCLSFVRGRRIVGVGVCIFWRRKKEKQPQSDSPTWFIWMVHRIEEHFKTLNYLIKYSVSLYSILDALLKPPLPQLGNVCSTCYRRLMKPI